MSDQCGQLVQYFTGNYDQQKYRKISQAVIFPLVQRINAVVLDGKIIQPIWPDY